MDFARDFSTIPPQVEELAKRSVENSQIDPALYAKYNVKRGLRDRDGKGVLTGLTEISEVWGHQVIDGVDTEIDGILRYRGYNVEDLIAGFPKNNNFSFEEVIYLLLFGELPTEEQFTEFKELLAGYRTLPIHFVRDIIIRCIGIGVVLFAVSELWNSFFVLRDGQLETEGTLLVVISLLIGWLFGEAIGLDILRQL